MNGHLLRLSNVYAVLALAACAAEVPTAPPPPITIAVLSGDLQSSQVASRLAPLRVVATQAGNPVEGVTVTWSATGGTVTPASTLTGNDGSASTNWDLPQTSGSYTADAFAADATNSPVMFTATATSGPPASFVRREGDGQSGQVNTILPLGLEVSIGDAFGNPVEGQRVNWVVTSGSATLIPGQSQSDAGGIATTQVQLGPTPGAITVSAAPTIVIQGAPVTFNLTATP